MFPARHRPHDPRAARRDGEAGYTFSRSPDFLTLTHLNKYTDNNSLLIQKKLKTNTNLLFW